MSDAARPCSTAWARMLPAIFCTAGRLWPLRNTHSAWVAAKREPRADEPAWYSTGVRCGDGSLRCIASTRYCLPW